MARASVEMIEGEVLPERIGDQRTIHERLVAILAALPAIGKDQRNQEQKFMYRSHDDVLNALNPLLAEHGVVVVPRVLKRTEAQRTTSRGSTMYEVNLHVSYRFYGMDGSYVEASAWGEGTDMGDKSTNKAMTMAFKNVLAQVFAVSTAESYDTDAHSPEETTRGGDRQPRGDAGQPEFDPGKTLLRGAIRVESKEDGDAVRLAQRELAPEADWDAIYLTLTQHLWEKEPADLRGAQLREWWTRLANAVIKAWGDSGGGFPPPAEAEVKAAFAWAFKGAQIDLTAVLTPEEQEAEAQAEAEAATAEEAAERALADNGDNE